MIISAIFISFVAQVIAGAFSANIAISRVARSAFTTCGIWELDDENAGDEATAHFGIYNYQMEARAADCAQNCHDAETAADPIGCNFFYNSSIGFTTKSLDRSPFEPFGLCRGGLYSAVTFDTGLVDANIIGVNSETAHKFGRQTTCSPLNMDYPYVNTSSRGPTVQTILRMNTFTEVFMTKKVTKQKPKPTKRAAIQSAGSRRILIRVVLQDARNLSSGYSRNPISWLASYSH